MVVYLKDILHLLVYVIISWLDWKRLETPFVFIQHFPATFLSWAFVEQSFFPNWVGWDGAMRFELLPEIADRGAAVRNVTSDTDNNSDSLLTREADGELQLGVLGVTGRDVKYRDVRVALVKVQEVVAHFQPNLRTQGIVLNTSVNLFISTPRPSSDIYVRLFLFQFIGRQMILYANRNNSVIFRKHGNGRVVTIGFMNGSVTILRDKRVYLIFEVTNVKQS